MRKHFFPRCWRFVSLWGESTGHTHTQRPVTRSFDVFVDLRLNKRKQSRPVVLRRHIGFVVLCFVLVSSMWMYMAYLSIVILKYMGKIDRYQTPQKITKSWACAYYVYVVCFSHIPQHLNCIAERSSGWLPLPSLGTLNTMVTVENVWWVMMIWCLFGARAPATTYHDIDRLAHAMSGT